MEENLGKGGAWRVFGRLRGPVRSRKLTEVRRGLGYLLFRCFPHFTTFAFACPVFNTNVLVKMNRSTIRLEEAMRTVVQVEYYSLHFVITIPCAPRNDDPPKLNLNNSSTFP